MKRVFLVDFETAGHHLTYLALLVRELSLLGSQVVVLSPDPKGTQALCDDMNVVSNGLIRTQQIPRVPKAALPYLRRLGLEIVAKWILVSFVVLWFSRGKRGAMVFFPWLDEMVGAEKALRPVVHYLFPFEWSGILMHRRSRQELSLLRSPKVESIFVLNERWAEDLKSDGAPVHVEVAPDFASAALPEHSTPTELAVRSAANGRPVIAFVGGLEKRKGLGTFRSVVESVSRKDIPWFFLVAGQLSSSYFRPNKRKERKELLEWLASQPDRVHAALGRIDAEKDFNALFRTIDVLWLAYEGFRSSSNLLTKAALFKVPVIATENTLLGDRVEAFRLGATIPEGNVEGATSAIQELLSPRQTVRRRFEDYAQLHSTDRMRTLFGQKLLN